MLVECTHIIHTRRVCRAGFSSKTPAPADIATFYSIDIYGDMHDIYHIGPSTRQQSQAHGASETSRRRGLQSSGKHLVHTWKVLTVSYAYTHDHSYAYTHNHFTSSTPFPHPPPPTPPSPFSMNPPPFPSPPVQQSSTGRRPTEWSSRRLGAVSL
jgi:hypothetical protein